MNICKVDKKLMNRNVIVFYAVFSQESNAAGSALGICPKKTKPWGLTAGEREKAVPGRQTG